MARRRKYVTSRKYRKTGQMGQGAAFLIVVSIIVLFTYPEYVIGVLAFFLCGRFIYKRSKQQNILRSGIEKIDRMDGRDFEIYLSALFKAHGYNAKVTQQSGDFGADLVLTKKNQRIVVQAKRYKGRVGIKAVQEVQSAVGIYHATDAWVVTNSLFTEQAYKLAAANGVRLINRDELIQLIREVDSNLNNVTFEKYDEYNT